MDRINITQVPDYSAVAGSQDTPESEESCAVPFADMTQISRKSGDPMDRIDELRNAALARSASGRDETPADHVIEATDATFDKILSDSPYPVFVDFYNPT